MAAAAVNVFSLEYALDKVVVHPGERRSVTVEVLRAREAGPLVEMVEMQAGHQVGQQAWGIWNRGPVEKLAKASHVLVLLEKTVLPILRQRPLANPPRLLDALGYYADNLRLLSARVGGSFNRDAQLYCDRVDALVAEALAPPQLNLYAKIQEGIDALAHLARRLLDAPHTISQVAEEEGAADEEGAEEGAADEEGAEEGAADEE